MSKTENANDKRFRKEIREVNKNNLLGGQFLIFLPKNPGK